LEGAYCGVLTGGATPEKKRAGLRDRRLEKPHCPLEFLEKVHALVVLFRKKSMETRNVKEK